MKRASILVLSLLVAGFFAVHAPGVSAQEDFTTLFDGSNLDAFNPIGDANWEIVGDVVQADSGSGFLVTKESYADFHLTLDFWVDEPANSGIFVRCADAMSVNDRNSYEVNIYDTRADQTYRTGGIVHIAAPNSVVMTGGRWNSYDIRVEGSRILVTLNGLPMVDVEDTQFADGPIALQYGLGVVKFRNVRVRGL
ncbi:MAG: DUF1080 domain-containing protein [Acidobacteria bacterium]|nr:DUF1080 domain-containing protein [Acidobacteriota bacterium]MYH28669.1 DUF1080 domain-containing protein [Acidobacteriota bacterium]